MEWPWPRPAWSRLARRPRRRRREGEERLHAGARAAAGAQQPGAGARHRSQVPRRLRAPPRQPRPHPGHAPDARGPRLRFARQPSTPSKVPTCRAACATPAARPPLDAVDRARRRAALPRRPRVRLEPLGPARAAAPARRCSAPRRRARPSPRRSATRSRSCRVDGPAPPVHRAAAARQRVGHHQRMLRRREPGSHRDPARERRAVEPDALRGRLHAARRRRALRARRSQPARRTSRATAPTCSSVAPGRVVALLDALPDQPAGGAAGRRARRASRAPTATTW